MTKHTDEHKHKSDRHEHHSDDRADDEEIKLDFKKIKNFFLSKNIFNKYTLIILLLIVCIFFSAYFRSYPASLPVTEDWARSSAYNSIRNNIAAQINQQYPNLPDANKNQLITEQMDIILKQQGIEIEQQIKATSDYFKSRLQNDDGQTYLLAIDPYQHLRRAENILKNGHVGDTLRNGKPYNTHQFAPIGKPASPELHPYFIFYFYKFLRLFNPNLSMLAAAFWVPVLISAFSVIPAFFIARRRAGIFGGFIAGMFVAVHAVFLGRTAGGFSDTDAYVVFFALMITWLFIEGFETKNLRNKIILTALAAFFVGAFSFSWAGWWYVFDLLLGLVLIYIAYVLLKSLISKVSFKKILSNQNLRNAVIVLIVFFICSAIFVPLFSGGSIQSAFTGPITRTKMKVAAHADFWPNIQTTVAELNPVSIPGAISQIGGKLLFFIASLGLVLSLVKVDALRKKDYVFLGISFLFFLLMIYSKSLFNLFSPLTYLIFLGLPVVIGFLLLLKDDRKIDIKYSILLILWFIGSMYASTKGTRFVLLLVPAFGIAMGISLGLIHRLFTKVISQEFKIKKLFVSLGIIALLCLFLIAPIKTADSVAKREVPSMNDAWWASLTRIKDNSSENAIINSWWDFGHWFKYAADRPVTVDGAGQDYQLAHWMGTILITDDEEKAVNTLRMLDCGSKQTYLTLLNDTDDILFSVNLTKTIIMQSEEEARQTLEKAGISQPAIEKTLGYSFCEPPENFLITSEDMVGKAGVWGHFGSWDFDRAFIYNTAKNTKAQKAIPILMEELGLTEEKATDYYYQVQALSTEPEGNAWIAPWPNYFMGRWGGCKIEMGEETEEDGTDNTTVSIVSQASAGVMVCNINRQISSNNQGTTMMETAVIDLNNYKNSSLLIASYNSNTGYKLGSGKAIPSSFLMLKEDGIERVEMNGTTFGFDVLIDMVENRILIADSRLSESLFTKLFYLDGRYTTHFEKFSDLSTVTGQRVIVWKVKWPQD